MGPKEKKVLRIQLNKAFNAELDKMGIPDEIIKYSKQVILNKDHYGWFERPTNKKQTKVNIYCAACQKTYEDFKPIHNTYGACKKCGNDINLRRIRSSKNYKI